MLRYKTLRLVALSALACVGALAYVVPKLVHLILAKNSEDTVIYDLRNSKIKHFYTGEADESCFDLFEEDSSEIKAMEGDSAYEEV